LSDANGSPTGKKAGGRRWPLLLGLPLVVLLAIGAVILLGGERASQTTGQDGPSAGSGSAQAPSQPAGKAGGQASGGGEKLGTPALGDEGAPVVMVEYSDYQ
jgi:protein-disulfide isomerase